MADTGPRQDPGDPPGDIGDDEFPFSVLRGVDLHPQMTASRKLLTAIALLEEEGAGDMEPTHAAIGKIVQAILEVEAQVVELRRRLDGP